MYIDYQVYEQSNVEQVSKDTEILQGENNITVLRFALPEKIRGYAIANYKQEIKFEDERGLVYRYDMRDEFLLPSDITRNKSAKVQLVLTNTVDEAEPIEWRTIPFSLEFTKSIFAKKAIGD